MLRIVIAWLILAAAAAAALGPLLRRRRREQTRPASFTEGPDVIVPPEVVEFTGPDGRTSYLSGYDNHLTGTLRTPRRIR